MNGAGIVDGASTLVVLGNTECGHCAALRNIAGVKVMGVTGVNVRDILQHKYVVLTESSAKELIGRMAKKSN